MNKISDKYKGKIKTPMDILVPKRLFDLCIKCEEALYSIGYKHVSSHEFMKEDGTKSWLYFMDGHIIWSNTNMSSYYLIKNETDIETGIKGRKIEDVRRDKIESLGAPLLTLTYGYNPPNDGFGFE